MLCVLQPICLPVPEATTILSGSVTLGANETFIIGMLGIMLGIIIMYKVSFFLGEKYLTNIKKSSKYKTYQKLVASNPFLTTGILFAIPILPDEIVCVGSAIAGVSLRFLLPIAIFSKTISIGMITYSSYIADALSLTQWQIIVIEVVLLLIFALVYSKLKKTRLF